MPANPNLHFVDVTFTCDPNAHSAADVLTDVAVIPNALRAASKIGYLCGFEIWDDDDQTAANMDVYLLRSNVSLGAKNAAISISDTNAKEILCSFTVDATADWKDLINSKYASKGLGSAGFPMPVHSLQGNDLYVQLVTQGTPTPSVNGIKARFYFSEVAG